MGAFWDFVASAGHHLGLVLGIIVGLVVLYYVVSFLVGTIWMFTVELYRTMRYNRKGVCYKCKRPFDWWQSNAVDQTYGPDQIVQGVCECGSRTLSRGNRRFADWAGF